MQNHLVCGGCRTVLLYPPEATNVRCSICNVVTSVPPAGAEMARLICRGCSTLLIHAPGASGVRCACWHTVNLVPVPNHVAHVNCGNCRTMLMYPSEAQSVRCALCHHITNTNVGDTGFQMHNRTEDSNSTSTATQPAMTANARLQNQTVIVRNPMSVDKSGKLVNNVAVGVMT